MAVRGGIWLGGGNRQTQEVARTYFVVALSPLAGLSTFLLFCHLGSLFSQCHHEGQPPPCSAEFRVCRILINIYHTTSPNCPMTIARPCGPNHCHRQCTRWGLSGAITIGLLKFIVHNRTWHAMPGSGSGILRGGLRV
ncbi:hypothetical protein FIBSPDRAFT_18526 [Athelia psychrophila]|uniref:Uncharacterized protein n=1 Tax=Athelia psychrophila TaxID=1759441 RepID=A0A166UB96_9AGAM|nr:hypothetical protein FIBSPDRAFT_18526 [Fibularhizoctonia sp. CBS 109695]